MNTAIFARSLESEVAASPRTSWANAFNRYWKSFVALFPAHQRSERLGRLISQYRTLPVEVRNAEVNRDATKLIDAVRGQTPRHPSWQDLDAVERALLTMLPGEQLKRYGWALRAEFQRATGAVTADQGLLKAYHDSKPPEIDDADPAKLRADLLILQGQLQELYANRRVQIRARNLIAFWTAHLFAVAIFITLQLDKLLHIEGTIVFDVFGVGMLGGVFSTLLRVQKFKVGGNCETTALSSSGNRFSVILAPAIGGVGALVLFVLLASGYLQGAFFPHLADAPFGEKADALEDLFKVHLATSAEAAKLYLLCFLSGFSERLVPDVMSRLSAMAKKEG